MTTMLYLLRYKYIRYYEKDELTSLHNWKHLREIYVKTQKMFQKLFT